VVVQESFVQVVLAVLAQTQVAFPELRLALLTVSLLTVEVRVLDLRTVVAQVVDAQVPAVLAVEV
jgi:hypothetical protein